MNTTRFKISAVIPTVSSRQDSLRKILKNIEEYDFIDDIVISKDSPNRVYGRYLAMSKAKNDYIYTQDDDCIVNNIEEIYNNFTGKNFVCCMSREHIREYKKEEFGGGISHLVGWGAMFPKKSISCLNKYIKKYGKDFLLKREADRIFTSLINIDKKILFNNVIKFNTSYQKSALYKHPKHIEYFKQTIEKIKKI